MRTTWTRSLAALALAALLLTVTGCGQKSAQTVTGKTVDYHMITVASASSMKPVLEIITEDFKENTGDQAQLVLGSSGLLARQIENGAPFDVYISANRAYMDVLAEKGMVVETLPYATGAIVLIGRATTLKGLKEPGIRKVAIANPGSAPYGAAAQEALENAGIYKDIEGKLIVSENVAQAYDFVKTGNADAGIVALSLAQSTEIEHFPIKQKLYAPIEQWVGIVEWSETSPTAQAFIDYLQSEPVHAVLEEHGFGPVKAE